jgi:HK97 family phage portal protein
MGIWESATSFFKKDKDVINKFNESFFLGSNTTTNNDDNDLKKYIDLAYNINPDVFSVISQMSSKAISIPYGVKEIKDKKSNNKLNKLLTSSKHSLNATQRIKALKLEYKALESDELDMPLERPNINQTWDEFWELSYIFLKLTGNVYWYKVSPEDGMNKGVPIELYVLPSHLIDIVLKENANMMVQESPVDYYLLTEYNRFTKFYKDSVTHISVNNPNFGFNGEHLYGQSSLRAAWKNIEASNKGLDLNTATLKNGGVFGFVHAKGTPFSEPQAKGLKDRIKEMSNDTQELGRIAGVSAELGFTRLSLSTDELKPFEYLKFNHKAICNVLGWSDSLLNKDDGGKHDKQTEERKRVLTDTTIPDTKVIASAFNNEILGLFKGYENTVFAWDYKDIPELQDDLDTLINWVTKAVDTGLLSRNEGRYAMRLEPSEDPNMDSFTVKDDVMTLQDAILPQDELKL